MATYRYNKYGDNLARKRRRRFLLIVIAVIAGSLLLVAFIIYALFYSPWMKITEVNIHGLKTISQEEILRIVDSLTNRETLGKLRLKPHANILFISSDSLNEKLRKEFLVIKSLEISKHFPHELIINIEERTPIGTWCRETECRYFDNSGVLWGKALKSSGSLLLVINDLRLTELENNINSELLEAIKKLIDGLNSINIKIKSVEIPADEIGDIWVYTNSVPKLMFSTDSDIPAQIEILKILIDQKDNFNPQYIDLRIDGRIYYK